DVNRFTLHSSLICQGGPLQNPELGPITAWSANCGNLALRFTPLPPRGRCMIEGCNAKVKSRETRGRGGERSAPPRVSVAILLDSLFVGQQSETIRVNVRLVEVSVVARNSAGEPLTDLTRDDFQILDNGKPQGIRFFALETRSAPAVVVVPLPEHVFSNRMENKVK